ncbi:hypothetical protein KIH77_08920 [Bifidobacterium sp. 82T24]|uniref:hypothetical protein n=1 Tax=Bifidobacterium pluvialisilvae TaxID=2834436 RepID=UPI001C591DD8|nr:hypothetical protein [Bifidobacterium pluvialisilvae]MBW3088841.1 hypothetical protein [Bifidobacterium pluvialisilvae]
MDEETLFERHPIISTLLILGLIVAAGVLLAILGYLLAVAIGAAVWLLIVVIVAASL